MVKIKKIVFGFKDWNNLVGNEDMIGFYILIYNEYVGNVVFVNCKLY